MGVKVVRGSVRLGDFSLTKLNSPGWVIYRKGVFIKSTIEDIKIVKTSDGCVFVKNRFSSELLVCIGVIEGVELFYSRTRVDRLQAKEGGANGRFCLNTSY